MIASERIRFRRVIVLILVINETIRGHVLKHNVSIQSDNKITTTEGTTAAIAGYTTPRFTSNLPITSATLEEFTHDRAYSAGKWCLKLIAKARTNDSVFKVNGSIGSPSFERYPFILQPGNKCGTFNVPSRNHNDEQIFNLTVSWPTKSQTIICVEFDENFHALIKNVTITGDGFETAVGNPDVFESITEIVRCCPCKYEVVAHCTSGQTESLTLETRKRWFLIEHVSVTRDVIYWSYPKEGLFCLRMFRVDLSFLEKGHITTASYNVTVNQEYEQHEDSMAHFNLTLPHWICIAANVTLTPISDNNMELKSVTKYLEGFVEIMKKSSKRWDQTFSKCVNEIRVFEKDMMVLKMTPNNISSTSEGVFEYLDACQTYTLSMDVIGLDGQSTTQDVKNFSILNDVKTSVVDLHLIQNTTLCPLIGWRAPKTTANCIEWYLIEEEYYDPVSYQNVSNALKIPVKDGLSNNGIQTFQSNVSSVCLLKSISVTPIPRNGSQGIKSTLSLIDAVNNVHVDQISSNQVNIYWDPPKTFSECVEHYLVRSQNFVTRTFNTSITVGRVKPCENYSFEIVPVSKYGMNRLSAIASLTIPEPRILRVQSVQPKSSELQWSVTADTQSCIKEFQLTLKNSDDIFINNITIPKHSNLRKLEQNTYRYRNTNNPCALFKYGIVPISVSGRLGEPFEVIAPHGKPGPVRNIAIDTTVEREVTIAWTKPEFSPECVGSYRISYEDQNITKAANETSVTIVNLLSCVEYNFTIVTVDFSGEDSASVLVNATVKEEKLSGVEDLELTELDSRSVKASWKPPANGTFCVASYRYVTWVTGGSYIPDRISNSTTDTHVTFVDVFACTMYSVQVIPVSKTNNDGNNGIAEIMTKERVILRYHIDPIRVKNQMAKGLELQTALMSENNNNCDLISVRFTCSTNNILEEEVPKVITGEADITELNATFSAIVTPLQPYTEYNCTAAILNLAGWSDETALAPFMTGEDFPEQPQNLQLRGDARMIELSWKAPKIKNGIISRYRVHIRSEGVIYPIPSYCPLPDPYNTTTDLHEDDENAQFMNWNNDELNHKIYDLNPYTDYVVQVAAATKAGLGPYTEMVSVATLPEQPEPVYEFSEYNVTSPEIDKPYNSTVNISWKIPCNLYGRLRSFKGKFISQGTYEHTFDWTKTIAPNEEIMETYSLTEERLEPERQYNVSIMVFVEDVSNHSEAKFLSFLSPAGIPNITNEINWGTVNVMDAPNPTKTARIWLSDIIFQSNVGNITSVALLVSERHCQPDPVPKRNISIEWPNVLSWKAANQLPCIPQYQTTPENWNPVEGKKLKGRQTPEVEYIIGKDQCEEAQEYCNGALKPGTEYALIVRIFTSSGYSDSAMQVFYTDSLIQLTVIVLSIFICLLLAFSLGLVILWRTQKLTVSPLATVRSPNEEPADIPLKSFSGIYEELIQSNREKINKEYQAINFFSDQLISEKVTFFVAKENGRKNRYLGIFPYDGNRVPLDVDDVFIEEDEESNDYINASFIDGYKYQREYIATQGPKKETCFDFWRMILQYEVESIVMLTQTVENDRIKCYQYFPLFNQTLHFRDVSVKCTQELSLGFYQKRLFLVTRENMTKAVFHYHFLTWPDHGCPSSASDLIKFIKIIRSERKNLALPVVIHCSAGVGRTGTFIALDIILQRIQQEKKINIYETVKQLRTQRVKMVQTSEQYAFLYHACLEYTTRNNKKKPKTSTEEISTPARISPDAVSGVVPKNGRRPMINIKFPKYVHSGISNVKSYVPDDVESKT